MKFFEFLDDPFFNPFREIFETKTYPYARTYRTNFKQKLHDTFRIFAGEGLVSPEKQLDERQNHLGLFDYATLGLSYGLARLCRFAMDDAEIHGLYEDANSPNKTARGVVALVWAATHAVRYLVSGIFTLLASPFVGAVALATHKKRQILMEKVKSFPMVNEEELQPQQQQQPQRLGTLGYFLETLRAAFKKASSKEPTELIDVDYKLTTHNRVLLFINPIVSPYNPNLNSHFPADKKVGVNPNDPRFSGFLQHGGLSKEEADRPDSRVQAFLELNVGNVTEKLENRGFFNRPAPKKLFDTTLAPNAQPDVPEEKQEEQAPVHRSCA